MILKNTDGGTMAGFRVAVLSVVVAGAGAWTMTVRSCCETHACENMRFLYGQIAGGYETCCQKTLAQQDACFDELDDKIREMIAVKKPVLFDCRVTKEENCFPMIPSGKAHNEMIMAGDTRDLGTIIDDAGKGLV